MERKPFLVLLFTLTFNHLYTSIGKTILRRENMENLVFEGFKFMILGMGTVFAFLILMIIAMNIQSYIIHKFFPEPQVAPTSSSAQSNSKSNKGAKVAAISAAITHHNNVKS